MSKIWDNVFIPDNPSRKKKNSRRQKKKSEKLDRNIYLYVCVFLSDILPIRYTTMLSCVQ